MNDLNSAQALATQECIPCKKGSLRLTSEECERLAALVPSWTVVGEHHLQKSYTFPDYAKGLAWVVQVSEIAESMNHHPEIVLAWGKVEIRSWTHTIDGLHQNDFILAAKIDQREKSPRSSQEYDSPFGFKVKGS